MIDTMTEPLSGLERRRDERLALAPRRPLRTADELEALLRRTGLALRYRPSASLPLASVYQACWGKPEPMEAEDLRPAIAMTHELLARRAAVETNAVAERVVLAHRELAPSLCRLARRGRAADHLEGHSPLARRVFERLLDGEASVGELRRSLGLAPRLKDDPALTALAELQRAFRVDRGPSSVPAKGIPYLSPEGYPWRAFHRAHPDLERAAAALDERAAARLVASRYLSGAGFALERKLASMLRGLLAPAELREALDALRGEGRLEERAVPRGVALVWRGGAR